MTKSLKILPLGGLGEIGMNMMLLEYDQKAIIVDCGVMFSDGLLPGIDLIIPDFQQVLSGDLHVLGIVLTHGHEDHIGALPFLLRQRPIPVYASHFTLEIIRCKLREHQLSHSIHLHKIKSGQIIDLDPFHVECIQVSHSIPDALAFCFQTPVGKVLHTGDFRMEAEPADGITTNIKRLTELGDQGVLLLMSDSTNVEIKKPKLFEKDVFHAIDQLMKNTPGWFVLSSFASHVPRMIQFMNCATKQDRKMLVMGRTMIQNVEIARRLGYLKFPNSVFVDAEKAVALPREKLAILCTGSQGEPRSALMRMALNQHKEFKLRMGDHVVLSSRFIPGNERAIYAMINHLCRKYAQVHTYRDYDVHVSGHPCEQDLIKMVKATRPKFFIPIHGEYRHLSKHALVAQQQGIPEENICLLENGHSIELRKNKITRLAPIEISRSVVDGVEFADIGASIVKDRRHLSEAGIVAAFVVVDAQSGDIIRGPKLFCRGVAFDDQMENLINEARQYVSTRLKELHPKDRKDHNTLQEQVRLCVRRFFKNQLDRKPVVIPIVIQL